MAMDGQSNMYVASLSGGSYTYAGDTVGYIVRVTPNGRAAARRRRSRRSATRRWCRALTGTSAEIPRCRRSARCCAARCRRGVVKQLNTLALDERQRPDARVAALFTLKQLVGAQSHPTLVRAASPSPR